MVEGGRAEGGQAPANLRRERRGEGAPRPTRPLGVPASRSPFFFSPPLSPSLQALSVPGDDRGGRHGRHRAHPLCRLFHADRRQLCRVAVGVRERGGGAAARGSRVRGGGGSRKDGRPLAAVYKTPALSTCTRPPPSLVLHSILSCALENNKHRGREERDGVVGCKNTDRRKNERKKKTGERMDRERARMKGGCGPFALATRQVSLSLSLPGVASEYEYKVCAQWRARPRKGHPALAIAFHVSVRHAPTGLRGRETGGAASLFALPQLQGRAPSSHPPPALLSSLHGACRAAP